MSENVKNPFADREFHPSKNYDTFIDINETLGTVKDIAGMFKKKVDPQDQQRKAGIWYTMIEDFLSNPNMTGEQLAAKYKDRLPFKQRSTKDRFVKSHFIGKSRAYIVSHLIDKINDELQKSNREAGTNFPMVTKDSLLRDLGLSEPEIKQIVAAKPTGRLTSIVSKKPSSGVQLPPVPKTLAGVVDPAFDRVKPLKPTMKAALTKKGVSPAENIEVLTNQFYNEIVRKDQPNNFAGQSELASMSTFDFSEDYADEATDAIITAVVTYIRNLRETKEQGGSLSKIQDIIVTGTERAEAKAQEAVKKEASQKVGEKILFSGGWVWILGAAVGLIVLLAIILRK